MQVISRPWGISVQGAGVVSAAPDVVRIRFRVTRVERTPARAFDETSAVAARVRATLRDHGIANVKESRLRLETLWTYETPVRTLAGYQCQVTFAVESANLDGVQQLLVDLVSAGANEVDAVEYDVRAREELHAEASRKAIAVARAQAVLYAQAADVWLGAVVHVEDAADPPHAKELAMARSAGPADDLAPGEITVSAVVRVGFAITRE